MSFLIYSVKSKNDQLRFLSTSGGLFSELATYIFDVGGYVSGAIFDNELNLIHCVTNNINDLEKLRRSKYLESNMLNVFKSIKLLLDNDKMVLFVGTPCQVAGLKAYLAKDYFHLITVDFICRGVNSPKAFRAWVEEIEHKRKLPVSSVWFKYKQGGWKTSPMRTRVDFSNGSYKIFYNFKNLYMYGYLYKNLYLRPSCEKCRFKSEKRESDLTMGDFWGLNVANDDDKGTSFLMINTSRGESLVNSISDRIIMERVEDYSFNSNPMFDKNVVRSNKTEKFFELLSNYSFSKSLKIIKCFPQKNNIRIFLSRVFKKVIKK